MDNVKILHCADLHIGAAESFLGTRAKARQTETLITFEKIINIAKENNTDIMLIAGDLFDSNNIDSAFVNRVFECFEQIPKTKIVFAAGNHDPLNADSPFKKHKSLQNLYVLGTKDCFVEFSDLNVRVYGKSFKEVYVKGEPRFSLTPDKDFINIMCIHGELKQDLASDYNAVTNEFIENSGMDYIALGHVHKRTEVKKSGNTYFAYCGCAEGQGFDELQEKGIYLGEISKGFCNLKFVPTAKRMHIFETVDISDLSDSSEIADKIIDFLKQKYSDGYTENLYKIAITGGVGENAAFSLPEITSRLNEQLYFAKVKDKTEIKADFETLVTEQNLKGVFVKNMLAKIQNAQPDEKEKLKSALNIGLKAFCGEVSYDED